MLALACGGNDLGPTTPPAATSEGKSGSATSAVTPAPVFTAVSITPATASVVAGLTTQLTASAQDQNGAPMTGATFTYRSADLTIARVSSTGLVTGVAPGGPLHIYVTGTIGAVTQSASMLVTVTRAVTPAPVFTSVSLTPATPLVRVGLTTQLTASAQDQNGAPMAGATFTYRSADLTIARVSTTGLVTGVAVGTIQIYVTGTIGSVTKSASVLVRVVNANTIVATSGNVFLPATKIVPPGGTVTWTFESLHNVTFASGTPANIPNTSSGSVSRRFCNVGVYFFHCTIHPSMTGYIYVRYENNVGGGC